MTGIDPHPPHGRPSGRRYLSRRNSRGRCGDRGSSAEGSGYERRPTRPDVTARFRGVAWDYEHARSAFLKLQEEWSEV